MANSVDPDETPRSAASHLGLYCLLRPVYPNTYGKYGTDDVLHSHTQFIILIFSKFAIAALYQKGYGTYINFDNFIFFKWVDALVLLSAIYSIPGIA